MLDPAFQLLCLATPVVVTAFNVPSVIAQNLDVAVVTSSQVILQSLDCWRILPKKFATLEEVTSLAVILVTLNAVEHKEGKHLII